MMVALDTRIGSQRAVVAIGGDARGESQLHDPIAARADAHQRARILRDAWHHSPASQRTHPYGAAADRQERIGNGEL